MRTGWIVVCVVAGLVPGCWRGASHETPPGREPAREKPVDVARSQAPGELYALDEALADVLSGPLVHVGTGEWFGLFRINACAYRNDRVIVVNLYCTTREMSAFGLVVLSPVRGRVYLYAEAKSPISKLRRADYFSFKGEAELAIADAKLPALELAFTYAQLRVWDERRYYRDAPGCFGGVEINRPQSGCSEPLRAQTERWAARNKPFLAEPSADWYRIVRELRDRAPKDGKNISHPGG